MIRQQKKNTPRELSKTIEGPMLPSSFHDASHLTDSCVGCDDTIQEPTSKKRDAHDISETDRVFQRLRNWFKYLFIEHFLYWVSFGILTTLHQTDS